QRARMREGACRHEHRGIVRLGEVEGPLNGTAIIGDSVADRAEIRNRNESAHGPPLRCLECVRSAREPEVSREWQLIRSQDSTSPPRGACNPAFVALASVNPKGRGARKCTLPRPIQLRG